ncbi:nicotinate-nucleotide--dimethylbenzimidazole phosphoribosyltransferase [Shewanella sp. YIC-542]|uniref:nicotinate-nucleotide--dimethylbenzimidazole phosphoribosyltransferase n=1 Tax=Shewanella mytili TaxID=3377111 RepID=UPI00398EBC55
MYSVTPVNHSFDEAIKSRIHHKTKLRGSLGKLEEVALKLARIQFKSPDDKLAIKKPVMLVFAADHGVADFGVSVGNSALTAEMIENFVKGGAAINVFCRQNGLALEVIDCGTRHPLSLPQVINQRLGDATKPIHLEEAMSIETVFEGFKKAKELVKHHIYNGSNMLAVGEIGIGNTTSASAVMAALTGITVAECTGRGSGIDEDSLKEKRMIVERALQLHYANLTDPVRTLACLGGFEIVQMTGAMLAAAEFGVPVVVDGFTSSVAALAAVKLAPGVREYLIFAHQSAVYGHKQLLGRLDAHPMLHLNLRLGEGSGAALAMPLLHSAVNFYNEMAAVDGSDAGYGCNCSDK